MHGKTQIIRKNQAFFLQLPGEECYYFDERANDAPWEFLYILLSGDSVRPYYEYAVNRLGNVMEFPPYHPAVKLLFEMHRKAKDGLFQNAFAADGEAFRFLCLPCDAGCSPTGRTGLIDSAKAYMDEHFAEPITLSQAAEALGVSQSHLSREFVRQTGENPIHYLIKVRIEHAVRLLVSTDAALHEISRRCGFSDVNYFSKVFKKYMKIPPGEFRRKMQSQGYRSVRV